MPALRIIMLVACTAGSLVALTSCANFLDPATLPFRLPDGTVIYDWVPHSKDSDRGNVFEKLTVTYSDEVTPGALKKEILRPGSRFHGFVFQGSDGARVIISGGMSPYWGIEEFTFWSLDGKTALVFEEYKNRNGNVIRQDVFIERALPGATQ